MLTNFGLSNGSIISTKSNSLQATRVVLVLSQVLFHRPNVYIHISYQISSVVIQTPVSHQKHVSHIVYNARLRAFSLGILSPHRPSAPQHPPTLKSFSSKTQTPPLPSAALHFLLLQQPATRTRTLFSSSLIPRHPRSSFLTGRLPIRVLPSIPPSLLYTHASSRERMVTKIVIVMS